MAGPLKSLTLYNYAFFALKINMQVKGLKLAAHFKFACLFSNKSARSVIKLNILEQAMQPVLKLTPTLVGIIQHKSWHW